MAYSYTTLISDGATLSYTLPFPYLDPSHISAVVTDPTTGAQTPYAGTLSFPAYENALLSVPVTAGKRLTFLRTTPVGALDVTYYGGALHAGDLNLQDTQLLYIEQELEDDAARSFLAPYGDPLPSGRPGPLGQNGAQGPQGPQGPQGIQGIPGAGSLGYTPVNKAGDTATNLLLAYSAMASNSAGLANVVPNEQDGNYTTTMADWQGCVQHNSSSPHAHTIPPNTAVPYPVGAIMWFHNLGSGIQTITRGAGVTIVLAGSHTSKDAALAQDGLVTAWQYALNAWKIIGNGAS